MSVSIIVASTVYGGIGFNGSLPWPTLTEDMAWFRKHTLNQIVIMGRKTWDDPKMPKPLPKRINCVLTHGQIDCDGVKIVSGEIANVVSTLKNEFVGKNIFIIGGKTLFENALPIVDNIYYTLVHQDYQCDVSIDINAMLYGFSCIHVEKGNECTFHHFAKN